MVFPSVGAADHGLYKVSGPKALSNGFKGEWDTDPFSVPASGRLQRCGHDRMDRRKQTLTQYIRR